MEDIKSNVILSILIPVYNWDISLLLKELDAQRRKLPSSDAIEIIVVDDGSTRKFKNSDMAARLGGVQYIELQENTGRAAVRNYLVDVAKGAFLLFLDADMLPDQDDFLQKYMDIADEGSQVVCGGISYRRIDRKISSASFHIYKSLKTEALPPEKRNTIPWRYVFTSNTMIRRDILDTISFDPRFVQYGFEDIEWAMRLSASYRIEHVDNTCSHMGVMDKQQLFERMRESTENYYLLYMMYPEKTASVGAVGPARYLCHLPDVLLRLGDKILSYLFIHISWNALLYMLFQGDKVVLLARKLKNLEKVKS